MAQQISLQVSQDRPLRVQMHPVYCGKQQHGCVHAHHPAESMQINAPDEWD